MLTEKTKVLMGSFVKAKPLSSEADSIWNLVRDADEKLNKEITFTTMDALRKALNDGVFDPYPKLKKVVTKQIDILSDSLDQSSIALNAINDIFWETFNT